MESTRRWFEREFPQGATLTNTMAAAILAHTIARKKHTDDALIFAATRVAPVLELGGYEAVERWLADYQATGCLWLSATA